MIPLLEGITFNKTLNFACLLFNTHLTGPTIPISFPSSYPFSSFKYLSFFLNSHLLTFITTNSPLMKISSFFKNHHHQETTSTRLQWPSCNHPKTLSFRAAGDDDIIKTVNSIFFDPLANNNEGVETPETWFTNSSTAESARSFSSESAFVEEFDGKSLEMVVRGARSERLFFEPGDTSSILEGAKTEAFPFKESVLLAMDSEDPYVDFRRSMEEMVETHGLKDWECLEELLGWYLKVNGKKNHGFIVDAFVDLLVALASNNSSSSAPVDSTSYSSAVSSFSLSSLTPLCHEIEINEIDEEEKMVVLS